VILVDADDRKAAEWGVVENIQRKDLNVIEEAEGYRLLKEQFGVTQEDMAERVGKSRPAIANALRMLELPDEVKHQGESAILVAPSNDFYIYPISCQGQWTHKFYVRVGDAEPVEVYNKFWTDYTKPYLNGVATNSSVKDGVLNVTKRAEMPGVHITAPTGTPVEIYLDKIQTALNP
jgi:hypothetical protein